MPSLHSLRKFAAAILLSCAPPPLRGRGASPLPSAWRQHIRHPALATSWALAPRITGRHRISINQMASGSAESQPSRTQPPTSHEPRDAHDALRNYAHEPGFDGRFRASRDGRLTSAARRESGARGPSGRVRSRSATRRPRRDFKHPRIERALRFSLAPAHCSRWHDSRFTSAHFALYQPEQTAQPQ